MQALQGILPIDVKRIPAELIAGLTLASLAIPEVMGYTKISGTPVITGLYTMLVPMVMFGLFGSSRHLVVGADSATAAILASGLVGLAATGSEHYLALAGVLAFMVAAFLILARLVGLGFMADFLSRTVLVGFLTGVGIQVAAGQISGMLGLKGGGHGTFQKIVSDLQQLNEVNGYALATSVAVLMVMIGARKLSKKIPGALIAVFGAILASWGLDLGTHMHLLGNVPSGLPQISLPWVDVHWDTIVQLLPTAFAMFVVVLAQSAATSRAYAARYNEEFSENNDLVGLGLANIGAAMTGTFVVNGSPTKTQMVDSAGGRSQLSLLFTAAIVLLVLLFFTAPLAYMPEAVLSAVVFLIGIDLIDLKGLKKIYHQRRSEFWVAVITLLMVVFVGVEQGIVVAIVLSLIDHTRRGYHPTNLLLAPGAGGIFQPNTLESQVQAEPGLVIYRFTHSMYFANSQQLSQEVTTLVNQAEPPLRWFCIDASSVDDIDYSAAETLRALCQTLKEKDVRLVVAQPMVSVRNDSHYDLLKMIGEDASFETLNDVLKAYGSLEK
ncbi:MAG: SulP family inorganic anion transporter [Desulfofustis sp. PB-SRB1]|jgi:SulP family sulfate permease|nr:SulP family inorganic anion transporter [Desulfofustis sp. PB-SRB1]MBM1003323.1 SulP family inorganic anion transporter [Desulfofustis sp. PB-SRB1]HBH27387.1 SulP family inorganic anion transporter [Desulfofustis sp.]HBH30903.1 SulP family inorganic anion transporter [Desulfofustis sp.]